MTDTILCIDIGTSSLKTALLGDKLRPGEIFVSRQYFSHKSIVENRVAEEYLPALAAALKEVTSKNPDYAIEAVCVSGNGPTVISDDGTTLLHNQFFVNGERGRSGKLGPDKKNALKKTKSLFIPRLSGFKHNFKFSWESSSHIFGAPEFLLYKLTNQAVSILPEDRFLSAYWNDDELLSCGFSKSEIKKLPPFVKSGSFVGKISENAALATGLLEGTFVFAGGPDFVTALVGTGTVFPGRLCDRAGSSEGLNLCTTKPVFAEGLRTMPSVIPGLWNVSYLVNPQISTELHRFGNGKLTTDYTDCTDDSDNIFKSEGYLKELSRGINLLREAAVSNGEIFPDSMAITGGQALDEALVAQKEAASGLKIKKMPCCDAELIGDLILARVSLGDYDDISEAVFAILGGNL